MMLLQQSAYSNITGTGSQVTPGFPHSQFRLRVASPKVREHGRTTPMTYELASDTYYGLGVMTVRVCMRVWQCTELEAASDCTIARNEGRGEEDGSHSPWLGSKQWIQSAPFEKTWKSFTCTGWGCDTITTSWLLIWLHRAWLLRFWTIYTPTIHRLSLGLLFSFILIPSSGAGSYPCTITSRSLLSLYNMIWLESSCTIQSTMSTTILGRYTSTFA